MSTAGSTAPAPAAPPAPGPRQNGHGDFKSDFELHEASWSVRDKIGLGAAWAAGLMLCVIAGTIVTFMFVQGIKFIDIDLLTQAPAEGGDQSTAGGFLDPLLGTLILTVLGVLIALPIGVAIAIWLSEYGRPKGLARAVESGVEIVAGTPSIVLAIFGLIFFSQAGFELLQQESSGGSLAGRSFLIAGIMMSLIALPLVVAGTREALQAIPSHVREASYALGKDRASTIRRVLLPASRSGIATGASLGMGRIAGDTAIVVILLGATLNLSSEGSTEPFGTLRGTGSTLTSYVYNNSPVGEGNAYEKAYAAAFVLLIIVILLNFAVDVISGRRKATSWTT